MLWSPAAGWQACLGFDHRAGRTRRLGLYGPSLLWSPCLEHPFALNTELETEHGRPCPMWAGLRSWKISCELSSTTFAPLKRSSPGSVPGTGLCLRSWGGTRTAHHQEHILAASPISIPCFMGGNKAGTLQQLEPSEHHGWCSSHGWTQVIGRTVAGRNIPRFVQFFGLGIRMEALWMWLWVYACLVQ